MVWVVASGKCVKINSNLWSQRLMVASSLQDNLFVWRIAHSLTTSSKPFRWSRLLAFSQWRSVLWTCTLVYLTGLGTSLTQRHPRMIANSHQFSALQVALSHSTLDSATVHDQNSLPQAGTNLMKWRSRKVLRLNASKLGLTPSPACWEASSSLIKMAKSISKPSALTARRTFQWRRFFKTTNASLESSPVVTRTQLRLSTMTYSSLSR